MEEKIGSIKEKFASVPVEELSSLIEVYREDLRSGVQKEIEKAYKKIVSNTKKKLYLKRCKFLVSNLYTTDKVLTYFDIKPTTIYHSRDNIYDKLKVTH